MPTAWTRLMELKPSTFHAHLKLRLMKSYDLMSYRNAGEVYARECIFHDNEGNRILAIFQKDDIPKFGPALNEGKLYRISNPIVLSNNKPNITPNKFKLSFGKRTAVSETFDAGFPENLFNFKAFGEINQIQNFENAEMFDLIGALFVEEPAMLRPINGRETLIMDISLEDLEGTRVACTLWGEYALDLMNFLEKGPMQPVIAVIQFCRPTKYNGSIKASTFYNVSKMMLDENIPEINTFKERVKIETN